MRVALGDFVELAPLLGEEAPRVVQVVALWSEGPEGGGGSQGRMFARVRRFYRPQVRRAAHAPVPGMLGALDA